MLPSVISRDIQAGITSFLRSTFPPSTRAFSDTLEQFLNTEGQVFKGPYYNLRLPFRPAPDGMLPFTAISFPYRPHLHQAQAFSRLCGESPRSTLVATGTGSGKTECFLYPILDACAQHAGEPGIKAIVIYPMNALATDQAKRFARAIHSDPALQNKVRAGLFIGGEGDDSSAMSPEWLITDKDHLRQNPPDILLTNYKMLDYLLLRPTEQPLWGGNAPTTLRYLVVDELHTFDGAQATDLACLIRRLKARLRTPAKHLCCVGTSATLGSTDSTSALVGYATKVFAESFSDDCVIGEHLLSLQDFTADCFIAHHAVPLRRATEVTPNGDRTPDAFLASEYAAWFEGVSPVADLTTLEGRVLLGLHLRQHSFFRNLLTLAERSHRKILSEEWMVHELAPLLGRDAQPAHVRVLLDGFLSLCAHARHRDPKTGSVGPLLRVHAHLWIRELSRLVASVATKPAMAFSDDLAEATTVQHLPVIHCRECGTMGWGATQRANNEKLGADLQEFYTAFFHQRPELRFLFPVSDDGGLDGAAQRDFTHLICGRCLRVHGPESKACHCHPEAKLVSVRLHDRTRRVNDQTEADSSCPYCESRSGITILGSRSASLTSVALSQLFTSPFNNEKKSLAFSDNVQDASHRAGFFSARTYRINLRTALAKTIHQAGAALTLPELQQRFVSTLRKDLGDAGFVGVFLPPNMEWMRDFESLRDSGVLPVGSGLPELVSRRLRWEVAAEVGYQSRIGRTLEKSGTAIAYAPLASISAAAKRMGSAVREKAGGFAKVSDAELSRLVLSWIHRLRTKGGIFEPELESYVRRGGDSYMHNQQKHLPGFSSFGNAPTFVYQGTTAWARFERAVASGTTPTWSQKRVNKVLALPLTPEVAGIIVEELILACREEGLIEEREIQGNRLWGISPGRLLIANQVHQRGCGVCGHGISCAEDESALWTETPCLRPTCQGVYSILRPANDYFGDLYRDGDPVRIRSEEHTGLLTRKDRERLESRFMAEGVARRPTDPNLLSSTPTLEMGVNIGDLSSVVLCSVPPATANYVQRVGRAGRKEGAATSLTIAAAKSHDLYYFEQPEDMLAGEIRPPGTFLDAPAVLERQFTAYCLDRWSELTAPRPVLPPKIGTVLDAITKAEADQTVFPYNFFAYIDAHLDPLLAGFLGLFSVEDLKEASRTTLEVFARGDGKQGGAAHRILLRLTDLAKDRSSLKDRIKRIGAALRKNRDIQARDEVCEKELHDLQQQRDGVLGMLDQIADKLTLNFFTDEGLLPNYAFPEEGVELRSIILKERTKPAEGGGKYEAETYEYVRPSSSAITELAPGNVFYVGGRRVVIDQVGIHLSQPEAWHFCDACNHMERVIEATHPRIQCPACGSPNWVDASLRRDLVRLRQVVSTSLDRTARSDDRSDNRDKEFFNRHESVVIPPDAERQAYQIRDATVPFGFEFLGKLMLRVVNLGQEAPETHSYRLGGKEVTSNGFALCPDCGKVQTKRSARGDEELRHDLSCRRVGKPGEPLRAVFLYRELQSEAIRVLLPATGDTAAREMDSFVAALHLGLRLFFRGSIDHLKGSLDEQPVRGSTQLRRRYLVLYDQVPGGTGYLKQLSQRPDIFLEVLRLALAHLEACSCQTKHEHDTDGCHRCILQARHNRDHATLSRQTAIRLLKGILEHASKLEAVPQLSDIDIHPLIESELEKRFLAALRAEPGAQLQEKIVRGKAGFLWRLGDAAWEIALQVPVLAESGIAVPSRPDFIFYPVRVQHSRPIAVFLDGYDFHANESAGRNRINRDVEQRYALISSGNYWVWNLSWEDIDYRNEPAKIYATRFGQMDLGLRKSMASGLLNGSDLDRAVDAAGANSWALFLDYLQRPAPDYWVSCAFLSAVSLADRLQTGSLRTLAQAVSDFSLRSRPVPAWPLVPPGPEQPDGMGAVFSAPQLAGAVAVTLAGVKARDPSTAYLLVHFDDDQALSEPGFPAHWRGFLALLNRVQFLPWFNVLTSRLAKAGEAMRIEARYDQFITGGRPIAKSGPVSGEQAARLAECGLAHPLVRPLLLALNAKGLPWPQIGYELMPDGSTVGTAELAWPDRRLAIFCADQADECPAFEAMGWRTTIIPPENWPESDIAHFIEAKLSATTL
jgi:DEAD/DEAH box helicase domain-containing protein